jgi:chromate transport protein ChrA
MRTLNLFLLFFFLFALNSYAYSGNTRGFFRGIYYYVGDIVCSVFYNLGISGDCRYQIEIGTVIFWLLLIMIVGSLLNRVNGE